jgi:RNA polymerase sigma-70 factor (ECF subfamily)
VYRTRKGYRPKSRFSTWLFTIANNLALNYLRGRSRNPTTGFGDDSKSGGGPSRPSQNQLPGREGTPSSHMRQIELAAVVREALDSLGDDQKLAVVLNKFEEMSYAEIAEIMGRSEPAIKSLLARARMNLRDRLDVYLRAETRAGEE